MYFGIIDSSNLNSRYLVKMHFISIILYLLFTEYNEIFPFIEVIYDADVI